MLHGKKLRERFQQPGILIAAGAHDCLGARLFEQAGFEAIYMTGNGVSASMLGAPDIGLLTMSEMASQASRMQSAVNIPVIADADTGYGNVNNVARTVREYELAGVAAIQLEDQVTPKRCGAMAGVAVISVEEAQDKIRTAVSARQNPDAMLIIGRSDARKVSGFEDALRRGKAYAAAGADIVFIEMLQSKEEIQCVANEIPVPVMFNALEGRTVPVSASELEAMGVKILSYPLSSTLVYAQSIKSLAPGLRRDGVSQIALPHMEVGEYEQVLGIGTYS
ncbi:oxaloacetate decarboxylase [Rhizobium leguminosarum]|uniref:isocitrate lyase/PEP mutase family protein n=1 Tax=Rhizobium leguminosarum TaxID=384 RepID=UPI001C955670|nr:isocitrate lyase/PEP mutase family protein [Rhizobium leguminosarum]MBY5406775.1 isocitrate lyase/PEP mutase family protein [Rhizobium leguminosarum]